MKIIGINILIGTMLIGLGGATSSCSRHRHRGGPPYVVPGNPQNPGGLGPLFYKGKCMPYIKQKDRKKIIIHNSEIGDCIIMQEIIASGELNFAISMLIKDFVRRNGQRYQVFNDVIGALEGAKMEFNRRYVAPFEDTKISENGDL